MLCIGSIIAVQGFLIINPYDYTDTVTMPQTYTEQSTRYWGKARKKEVTAYEKKLRSISG